MNRVLIILFLISVFIISFLPVKDPDFGWHYQCGKKACFNNRFSYFLPDYKAAYPGFLYDKSLAFIFNHSGFVGISLASASLMTIAALLFSQLTSWLFFFPVLLLSWPVFNLGLRPQIITYLFFLLTLFILKKSAKNQKWLFTFPFLFLIWVNTHIGFFIGLIILLLKQRFFPIIILILSFLATIVNPFGINVYREIFNHLTSPLNTMIAEWTKPVLWQQLLIVSLTFIYLINAVKKKTRPVFEILILLFFSLLAINGVRNLPFFYTIFFYVIASEQSERGNLKTNKIASVTPRNDISLSVVTSLIIFIAIINIPKTISFDSSWKTYCNEGVSIYPCQAIKDYPKLSGNVYAAYEWGGFLIWQKPDIKVFVDGRMPAWKDKQGKSPYQVYLEIIQTQLGWNEKLNLLKTDYLLINNGTFLDLLLQKEAVKYHWQETYRDNVAVIYKNIGAKGI